MSSYNLYYDWDTQLPIVTCIHNQVKLSAISSCGYGRSMSTDTKYFNFILTRNCGSADLGPGETLITWPILNGFPDFKDQQTHDTPDVLLVLFLKKLTTPRQS